MREAYVYILFNKPNGTLYTGVTNNLMRRMMEHKKVEAKGFAQRYGVNKLAWFESGDSMVTAIEWEKKLKGGSRKQKLDLIMEMNPKWRDLSEYFLPLDCFASSQ